MNQAAIGPGFDRAGGESSFPGEPGRCEHPWPIVISPSPSALSHWLTARTPSPDGEQRGEEWGGAHDEREAGPGERQRHAQGGRGEAAPRLGGSGSVRRAARTDGPARGRSPRRAAARRRMEVGWCGSLFVWSGSGRAEWDPDLGLGLVLRGLGGFVDSELD